MCVVQAEAYRRQYGFNAIVLVPGNVYGPYDNFDQENSHVIPALIRRFRAARLAGRSEVEVWGTGKATRDFIYIEDACRAILRGAEVYSDKEIINLSSGTETTIRELVTLIAELTGYPGRIRWDASKPEGQLFKGFDPTRMHQWLGYHCQTSLREGLRKTVAWFEANYDSARLVGGSPRGHPSQPCSQASLVGNILFAKLRFASLQTVRVLS
jgi:GDP-L-fucose synthase